MVIASSDILLGIRIRPVPAILSLGGPPMSVQTTSPTPQLSVPLPASIAAIHLCSAASLVSTAERIPMSVSERLLQIRLWTLPVRFRFAGQALRRSHRPGKGGSILTEALADFECLRMAGHTET